MSDNTVTGKLLQEAQTNIEEVIRANNLSKAETTLLRGQKLILRFIEEDHAKTKEMYEEYKDRRERRAWFDKYSTPVITALLILSVTNVVIFVVENLPKLQSLP